MNQLSLTPPTCKPALVLTVVSLLMLASSPTPAQPPEAVPFLFEYDAEGNPIRTVDPLGHATVQVLDQLGRVKEQVLPAPASGAASPTLRYEYDQRDQLVKVTDPRNLSTSYVVNGLGGRTMTTSPDTGTSRHSVTSAGDMVASKDARGHTTSLSYDALHRITSMTFVSGTPTTFEYDNGSASAVGRLNKMTDESGQTVFRYDDRGRLLAKDQTAAGKTLSLSYEYGKSGSALGKVTFMRYPSGIGVALDYNDAGELANMALVTAANERISLLQDIRYLPFGPAVSWTWGSTALGEARQYSRTFDTEGRMTGYDLGPQIYRALTYDAAGRIRAMLHRDRQQQDLAKPELDQQFDYDNLGRLTRFTGPTASQAYTYDATGNRLTSTFGARTYVNTYAGNSNRLINSTGPVTAGSRSYDMAGNLVADGATTYTYNARGRMQAAQSSAGTVSFLYNGFGERVRKKSAAVAGNASQEVFFVYDPAGPKLLGEYSGSVRMAQEIVYLGNTPIAVIQSSPASSLKVYYVYPDQIDTPRVVVSASNGKTVWRWDTADPFGVDLPVDAIVGGAPFRFNLRFPGQYYDQETNQHYNYFRDYEPAVGRYVQSDPIGLLGGINTYSYVAGDPVRGSDPYGLAPGDRYKTVDAAGIQAIRDINPTSIAKDQEFGGRIYQRSDGYYSYTKPIPGKRDSADFGSCPAGTKNAGQYHTHGADSNGRNHDYVFSNSDMTWAEKENVPSYLGVPNGVIGRYTPVPGGSPRSGTAVPIGAGAK